MSSSLISVMFGDHCWHLELYHIKLIFIFAWTIPLSAIGIVHCNRIQVSSMDKQSYPIPSNRRPRSWVINQIRQVRLANQKRVNKLLDQHHPSLTQLEITWSSRAQQQLSKNLDMINAHQKQHLNIWALNLPNVGDGARRLWVSLGQRMACNGLLKGAVCFPRCDLWPIFLSGGETPHQKVFVWTVRWILIAQLLLFPD